jgi:hypothetical protein
MNRIIGFVILFIVIGYYLKINMIDTNKDNAKEKEVLIYKFTLLKIR